MDPKVCFDLKIAVKLSTQAKIDSHAWKVAKKARISINIATANHVLRPKGNQGDNVPLWRVGNQVQDFDPPSPPYAIQFRN